MIDFLTLLQFPFVQRAILAGVLLSVIAAVIGVLTLVRKAAFYGDAIAHSSLAGVALGLAFGWYPLAAALGYAIVIALLLPLIQSRFRLSLDNVLGIVLPSSMGLGVLIFSLLPGYQPEMMSYLFGSILAISNLDLIIVGILALISLVIFLLWLPKMLFISIDKEYASLLKIRTQFLERLYEILLATIIIAGVRLMGIILINALLIVPASTAKIHARSLSHWLFLSVIISLLTTVGGLLLSLVLNVPPGASIAVFSGILFMLSGLLKLAKR